MRIIDMIAQDLKLMVFGYVTIFAMMIGISIILSIVFVLDQILIYYKRPFKIVVKIKGFKND